MPIRLSEDGIKYHVWKYFVKNDPNIRGHLLGEAIESTSDRDTKQIGELKITMIESLIKNIKEIIIYVRKFHGVYWQPQDIGHS